MLRINLKLLILLISVVLIVSCNSTPQITENASFEKKDQMFNPIVKNEARTFRPELTYSIDSVQTERHLDSLFRIYSVKELQNILALNRMDKNRLRPGKKIVVPNCASSSFEDFSPFPQDLNFMKCVPKAVLISQRIQAFALYENGNLVRWGPVSTGKSSTRTPNGLNYGNYKAKRKISTVDDSWIMPYYFNFMNFEGIGTHQYALPGYPASHGCVRMYKEDAQYIFNWAEMWEIKNAKIKKNGTPFIVFGKYDYESERPWFSLSQSMKANDLQQEEIDQLRSYVDEYFQDPRNFEGLMPENSNAGLAKA